MNECGGIAFALWHENPKYMLDSEGNVYGPSGRILKPFKVSKGLHRAVTLGHSDRMTVHRMVAETFVPNPNNKPVVAHGDGKGYNNAAWNLRWATQKENISDKKIHGTYTNGERHHLSKLTDGEVVQIRHYKAQGFHVDLIAWMYDISRWTVYDICSRRKRNLTKDGEFSG